MMVPQYQKKKRKCVHLLDKGPHVMRRLFLFHIRHVFHKNRSNLWLTSDLYNVTFRSKKQTAEAIRKKCGSMI